MVEATAGKSRISFDGSVITIERTPVAGSSMLGAGQTVIPLSSVGAVEWKPAGRLSLGHLRLAVAGSQAAALPTPVNRDPNAIAFPRASAAAFEKVRDTIQAALSR